MESKIRTYDEFITTTGKRIMELRLKKQYTRKCLANMADISEKFLYEIEIGKKGCSCYIFYRLAEALEVGIDYLADHSEVALQDLEQVWDGLPGYQKEMMGAIMNTIFENFKKIW